MTASAHARDDLTHLLDFHVESGVDAALDEAPHDRFAEGEAPPAPRTELRRTTEPGTRADAPAAFPRELPERGAPPPAPRPTATYGNAAGAHPG